MANTDANWAPPAHRTFLSKQDFSKSEALSPFWKVRILSSKIIFSLKCCSLPSTKVNKSHPSFFTQSSSLISSTGFAFSITRPLLLSLAMAVGLVTIEVIF